MSLGEKTSICDYCDVVQFAWTRQQQPKREREKERLCQLNNWCLVLFVNEFSSQFADKIIYFGKKTHRALVESDCMWLSFCGGGNLENQMSDEFDKKRKIVECYQLSMKKQLSWAVRQ